jgi:hypothetical protein
LQQNIAYGELSLEPLEYSVGFDPGPVVIADVAGLVHATAVPAEFVKPKRNSQVSKSN